MLKANADVREKARELKIPFWAVAEAMSISEASMTRMLRRELPEPEKQKIFEIIEQIHSEKAAVSG